jgi:hypothetical protein
MRVLRHKRQTDHHRAPAERDRRPHVVARPVPAPAAPPQPEADDDHERQADRREERRMRASGGPEDHAHYRCICGYAFEADVSTSVQCPHCGAGQAW